MLSEKISIRVNDVSKCYHIYDGSRSRFKQLLYPGLQRIFGRNLGKYYSEFWALKKISFEIQKGETVGIIGRNGSGKSTLLQIISGILSPSHGSVEAHGRIAALLELGSGFNGEFTGSENVFINGALLGLSREEIEEKYDNIVSFADIGKFIDRPVKTYSSGMMIRLAFAVQSQIDPDILIVDEALSVGDAKFQVKCFERLRQLKENGTSILFVSHSSEQIVTHCNRAILLEGGEEFISGNPRDVVNRYMDLLFGKEKIQITKNNLVGSKNEVNHTDSQQTPEKNSVSNNLSLSEDIFSTRIGYNPHEYRWGDGTVSILDFYLEAEGVPYPSVLSTGQNIKLAVTFTIYRELIRPILGITIKTKDGVTVYGVNSETLACEEFKNFGRDNTVITAEINFICRLAPGDYFVSLGIATKNGEEVIPHDRRYDAIHLQVAQNSTHFGLIDLGMNMKAEEVAG